MKTTFEYEVRPLRVGGWALYRRIVGEAEWVWDSDHESEQAAHNSIPKPRTLAAEQRENETPKPNDQS